MSDTTVDASLSGVSRDVVRQGTYIVRHYVRFWFVNRRLVEISDHRPDAVQDKRLQMRHMSFRMSGDQIARVNFFTSQPDAARKFLYVKDRADTRMLWHDNPQVAAIAAWHVPVDDGYLTAAFSRPLVREMMSFRSDVPEQVKVLLEVAT